MMGDWQVIVAIISSTVLLRLGILSLDRTKRKGEFAIQKEFERENAIEINSYESIRDMFTLEAYRLIGIGFSSKAKVLWAQSSLTPTSMEYFLSQRGEFSVSCNELILQGDCEHCMHLVKSLNLDSMYRRWYLSDP